MHPVITQAIAAERTREMLAHAAAAGRGRQLRRSRRAGHLATGVPGTRRRHTAGPAPRPLRDPRAA